MANMNALFRKGYLFAGAIMAANMFVVNEVKAMQQVRRRNNNPINESTIIEDNDENASWKQFVRVFLAVSLYYENAINFLGMLIASGINNYFKRWNYAAGKFRQPGYFGYRTKRFLNGILQFEVSLNVGKVIPWVIPGIFGLIDYIKQEEYPIILNSTAGLIMLKILKAVHRNNRASFGVFYSIIYLLQGFVYMPLTLHLFKFSISISLDAILWELVAIWAGKTKIEFQFEIGS